MDVLQVKRLVDVCHNAARTKMYVLESYVSSCLASFLPYTKPPDQCCEPSFALPAGELRRNVRPARPRALRRREGLKIAKSRSQLHLGHGRLMDFALMSRMRSARSASRLVLATTEPQRRELGSAMPSFSLPHG